MKGKTSGKAGRAKRFAPTLLLALPFLVALAPDVAGRDTSFVNADRMKAILTFVIRHRVAVFSAAATLIVFTSSVVTRAAAQSRRAFQPGVDNGQGTTLGHFSGGGSSDSPTSASISPGTSSERISKGSAA